MDTKDALNENRLQTTILREYTDVNAVDSETKHLDH